MLSLTLPPSLMRPKIGFIDIGAQPGMGDIAEADDGGSGGDHFARFRRLHQHHAVDGRDDRRVGDLRLRSCRPARACGRFPTCAAASSSCLRRSSIRLASAVCTAACARATWARAPAISSLRGPSCTSASAILRLPKLRGRAVEFGASLIVLRLRNVFA